MTSRVTSRLRRASLTCGTRMSVAGGKKVRRGAGCLRGLAHAGVVGLAQLGLARLRPSYFF